MVKLNKRFSFQINDIKSSVVVFLVALPLCLGIALASNAPLSAGILAGIVGGIVVGTLGGSAISVSGPAAGLTVIVIGAINQLGDFSTFTASVMVAGIIQLALGLLKAGELGNFFPSSVIKGMLSAIGLILILKQLPHAVGWDSDFMGDHSFGDIHGHNTFSDLLLALNGLHLGAVAISILAISLILLWDKVVIKRIPSASLIPSALIAVVIGTIFNEYVLKKFTDFFISQEHLVTLPFSGGIKSFIRGFSLPNFSALTQLNTWKVAVTIALVASIETLLSLDAADKIDPLHRSSMKNKELRAQGIGNFLAGLIGALPITAVIVRTSANVENGGLTRVSAILHGIWLFLAVILFPGILNKIPLSALASILILVGFKLTSPSLIKKQWKLGIDQFVPFILTILAILFTDLLTGIAVGFLVGMFFVIKSDYHSSLIRVKNDDHVLIRFAKDVSFLHKSSVRAMLRDLPDGASVVIDGSRSVFVDHDIKELVEEFIASAPAREINVSLKKSPLARCDMFKE